MSHNPGTDRDNIYPGLVVSIVLKKDQGTDRRVKGHVQDLLTSKAYHPRGIKVRLDSGQVGRVQGIPGFKTEPKKPKAPPKPDHEINPGHYLKNLQIGMRVGILDDEEWWDDVPVFGHIEAFLSDAEHDPEGIHVRLDNGKTGRVDIICQSSDDNV